MGRRTPQGPPPDPKQLELAQRDGDLERRSRDLAERYRRADDADKEALHGELLKALEQQFDVRLERHRVEAEMIERRLAELRRYLDERAAHRDQIIERRLGELTGAAEPLDW